jgi:PAS domain S-box-containing protein
MKQLQLPNTFLDQSKDSLWMVNLDFKLIYANKTFLRIMHTITGKEQKLYDSVFREELNTEEVEKWKTNYNKAFNGEYFEIEDHYYDSKLKEIQYGQTTFEPLTNEDNKIFAVACRWKNVTNSIKHRKEENQLMDASLDVFCTFNADGEFVYASEASKKHWGYTPEELIGKRYIELTIAEDVSKTEESATAIESGNETKTFHNRFRKKDGGIAYNLWSSRWDDATKLFYSVARDNQEQVEQEEKIKQSEQRFKALVQEGAELFAIIDKTGHYIYMSPSSTKIIGIPPEAFIGRDAFEFLHPDDTERAQKSLKKVATQDRVVMENYRAKNDKNEWRWVETVLTNMLNNPAVKGIVINSRDITFQVEQEEKLIKAKEKAEENEYSIREAGRMAKIGYWSYDKEKDIISWSDEVHKIYGTNPEEGVPNLDVILDFFTEKSKKELVEATIELASKGKPFELELNLINSKNENVWIRNLGHPVYNEQNEIVGRRGVSQNITKEKNTQLALLKAKEKAEDNERKMKEAQKLAHLGSWYYDVINKVSEWSEETYNIWGFDPQNTSVEFLDHQKRISPKDLERFNAVVENATEKGIPYKMELELIMPNGAIKIVDAIAEPILNEKNQVIAFKGTTQDITKRIAIENQLRSAKERAEKSEYTMSQASKLAKIGYWYYDVATQILSWSDYIYRLYNLTPEDDIPSYEEAKGHFDSQSQEKITKATKEQDENGTPYDLELRMINSKNEEIWVRNLVQPVYNDQKEIVGKRGVIQNITEEKKLRELNSDVAKMVKIGSWSIDLEKNTIFWSDEIYQIYELDSKLYDPNLEEGINFTREDFRQIVQSKVENAIKTGEGWDFEAVIVTAKKNEIWIRSIGNTEFSNGKCVRIYGGLQDISKRKQAEDRLQSLADNLPGIIYQYVIYPDGTDALLHVSGDVEKIWGFTALEVKEDISKAWKQIELAGDLSIVKESVQKSIETNSKWQIQFKYIRPNTGKLHTHLGVGTPRFLADGTIVINAMVLDITEEAKNEALLEQTNKIAKIGSWEMDLINQEGDNVYWSSSIKEILEIDINYTPTLKDGIEFHIGESRGRIEKALMLLINEGVEFDEEVLLRTTKGNERWCRAIGKSEVINGKRTRIYGSYQDIHERKNATLDLKKSLKSLEDYKYSLDQAAIIASTNQKGEITSVNDNFCKISGFKQNEVIGKTHRIINSNHHTGSFFKELWKTIASGKVWRGEVKNKAKDGSYYWVDTTIVPFLNEKNKPTQYLAIRFDITVRKKAEEEKTRFQETLENSLNEIYMFDAETFKFNYVNKGAQQNLGYTKKELTALTPLDLKPDFTVSSFRELVKPLKSYENDKVVFFTNHKRKDGSLYPVEIHLTLVEDLDDKNFIAIVLDITERKKAEENLLAISERLQLATSTASIGIWDWDVLQDHLIWDETMYTIFGVPKNKFNGAFDAWANTIHPDDIDKANEQVQNSLKGFTKFETEFRVIWPDKSIKYVTGSAVVIKDHISGKPVRMIGTNVDITEIRNAELEILKAKEQIEVSEAKFKSYTEKSPIAIFTTDIGGSYTYVNETWLSLTGLSLKEALSPSGWSKTIHPDDLKDIDKNWYKSVESNGQWKYEFRFINEKNKKIKWVEGTAKKLFDDKNNLLGYLGTNVNITERKEAEEERNRLQRTLANSLNEIYIFDAQTLKFSYVNRGALLNLGYSAKEMYELTPIDLEPDFSQNSFKELITSLLNKEKEKIIVFKNHKRKDGSIYPVEVHLQLITEGNHKRFLAIILDITERKKAEEMYRLLANNTNDIIALQNDNFALTYISPAVEALLGYKPTELLDKKFFNIIHKEDVLILTEALKEKLFKGKTVKSILFRASHKKGHFIWLESLLSPIIKANRIVSIVSSTRDMTKAIHAKKEIQEYQSSLQRLTSEISLIEEKQKKEIAANIHDHLSQSLVISRMRIVDLEKKPELKNIQEDLGFIRNHISEALENSRKITYELSPPVLYQLGLIDALEWYADETEEKYGIKFQFKSNIDTVKLTEFKSILLFRCVQEAVTNCIKYAEASLITLEVIKDKNALDILITDNGKGFDTTNLNSSRSHGSGFGLFAVNERIKNMNGKLTISSEIKIGTKIKIYVPL